MDPSLGLDQLGPGPGLRGSQTRAPLLAKAPPSPFSFLSFLPSSPPRPLCFSSSSFSFQISSPFTHAPRPGFKQFLPQMLLASSAVATAAFWCCCCRFYCAPLPLLPSYFCSCAHSPLLLLLSISAHVPLRFCFCSLRFLCSCASWFLFLLILGCFCFPSISLVPGSFCLFLFVSGAVCTPSSPLLLPVSDYFSLLTPLLSVYAPCFCFLILSSFCSTLPLSRAVSFQLNSLFSSLPFGLLPPCLIDRSIKKSSNWSPPSF